MPREAVDVPLPEASKFRLDGALGNLIQWKMSLPTAGRVERDDLWRSLPTQTILWFYDSMKLSTLNSWEVRWELEEVIKTVGKRLLLKKQRTILNSVSWGGDLILQAIVSRRRSALPGCGSFYLGHMHWHGTNHLQGTSFLPLRREPKNLLKPNAWLVQEAKGRRKNTCWHLMTDSLVFMNCCFSSGRSVFPPHFPASCKSQLIKTSWKWRQNFASLQFSNKCKDVLKIHKSYFAWSNYLPSEK